MGEDEVGPGRLLCTFEGK